MLKVEEFLDIEKIEKIRFSALKKSLDEFDNFSYHVALFDGESILGVGRLYRQSPKSRDIYIDNIALTENLNPYYEMIFRTLLLKCFYIPCGKVFVFPEREEEYYQKFNLIKEGEYYTASKKEIIFPKECSGTSGDK